MLLDSIKDIVKQYNRIGIFVSGGLDSGFMLYLFHKFKLELGTDNQFKIYTVERPNQSMMFAQRMVDYINREFGSNHTINKVGTDRLHHSLHIASGIIEAGNDDTEVFVLADTLIPGEVPNGPKRRLISHPKVRQPWLFLAKDEIVQNCIDLELMDLMTISHSCETTNMIPCRICWHCKERNWAFWKCGYPDPLTIMSTDNLSY